MAAVVRLDGRLTGQYKPAYWRARFSEFVGSGHQRRRLGLAARDGSHLIGYLLGEVRAFEFGSAPSGWIFAVGVDPDQAHHGVGSALVSEAARQFREVGVTTVRTMVGRTDVRLLAFFRSNGFVGGRFTQLELDLPAAAGGLGAGGAGRRAATKARRRR
jgi:ribosomal protein S18 acetylase RimI-like enzyme